MGDRGRTSRAGTPTSAPLDPPRRARTCRLLGLDAAWAGSRAVARFKEARDALQQGGDLLVAGDLTGARAAFDAGEASAKEREGRPGPARDPAARARPVARRRTSTPPAEGANATADAAAGGTAYVERRPGRRLEREGHPGVHRRRALRRGRDRGAAPGIQRASELLTAAQNELAPVDPVEADRPAAPADDRREGRGRPARAPGADRRGARRRAAAAARRRRREDLPAGHAVAVGPVGRPAATPASTACCTPTASA